MHQFTSLTSNSL